MDTRRSNGCGCWLMLSHYADEKKPIIGDLHVAAAVVHGEKHHESERIGGIVSRRARPVECFDRIRWPFKILRDGWILKLPRQPVILAVDSPRIFSSLPHKAPSKLASTTIRVSPHGHSVPPLTSALFCAFHSRLSSVSTGS